ncbi:uncharacterized protein LOC107796164 isoform X2 [Nicotiana tabacum]|uniref:Uncharacterized protein LOC107796164 isoform X2 n=1 Tax=Nicotiana tabacum TaxID=4097 RepID=A0AC58UU43_TOBAC
MQSDFSAKSRRRSAAYKAASSGGESLTVLLDFWREEGVAQIDNRGDTILHFLAVNGNVAGFGILDPLSIKDLETANSCGDTPLHEAARFGKRNMVEMILRKEKDLVFLPNNLGETPLYVAAASGEKEIFTLLANFDFNKLTMKRNDGKNVLHAAVAHDCYGIPPRYIESKLGGNQTQTGTKIIRVERLSFTESLLGNSWLQEIDEAKQKHILALILAKMLVKNYDWNYSTQMPSPLIQASKLKVDELVVEIVQMHPEAVENLDELGRNIMHIAAEHKDRFLFDYLLKTVPSRNRMLADVDRQGNTILHYAANVGTPFFTSTTDLTKSNVGTPFSTSTTGHTKSNVGTPFFTSTTDHTRSICCVMAVLMMMWGMLWFNYIKYNLHPRLRDVKNSDGLKAEEIFERNHLRVRKEAETSVRELSNSMLVLSTLLCTINFAAIFTVPGGFEENTGLPILLDKVQQELWMLMFYLGAALFSSVFTMGTLLSFLLCKFYSNDFYISLPTKIIIAIISVFYATAFTILACLQALNLENIFLNKDVWWLIIAVVAVGFIMTLIYIDLAFPVFDYMYYLVSYSFFVSYKK